MFATPSRVRSDICRTRTGGVEGGLSEEEPEGPATEEEPEGSAKVAIATEEGPEGPATGKGPEGPATEEGSEDPSKLNRNHEGADGFLFRRFAGRFMPIKFRKLLFSSVTRFTFSCDIPPSELNFGISSTILSFFV